MEDQYIVRVMPDTDQSVIDKIINDIESAGGEVTHRYAIICRGFAARIPKQMLNTLKAHEKIASIDANRVVYLH